MKKLARIPILVALVASALAPVASGVAQSAPPSETVRVVDVVVEGRYTPARISFREGEHIRLRFVRRDYGPCTREVVFPSLGLRKTLPTNEAVVVDLPDLAPGEYAFRCGMNMIHGTLVVLPR